MGMGRHRLGIAVVETSDNLKQYANPDGVMVWRQSEDGSSLWPIDLNPTQPAPAPCYVVWET